MSLVMAFERSMRIKASSNECVILMRLLIPFMCIFDKVDIAFDQPDARLDPWIEKRKISALVDRDPESPLIWTFLDRSLISLW